MKKLYTMLVLICLSGALMAQDPLFSQYYASPLYLNPGFTGSMSEPRLTFNSRVQWTQLPKAFNTFAASADFLVKDLNSGFGLMAITDRAGSVNLRTSSIGVLYSSKIRLSEKWVASPGLMFSYGNRAIDMDKMVFADQIIYNGPTSDDAIGHLGTRHFFDFSTGLVIYNKTYWAGFSVFHLNKPNHSMLGEQSRLPQRYSLHAGAKVPLRTATLSRSKLSSFMPSMIYTQQGDFRFLDIGGNLVFDPVLFGLYYRGTPFHRSDQGYYNHDAVIFLLGMNLKYLEVGYSYDLTISRIGPSSGGSHEISVMFLMQNINPNKVSRKDKILPCPNYTGFQWRE